MSLNRIHVKVIKNDDKIENDDEAKCEFIINEINDFFEQIKPKFKSIKKILKQYIQECNNEKTKKILRDLSNNSLDLWNKIINDFNNVVRDFKGEGEEYEADISLNRLLSLFLQDIIFFGNSGYYNKSNIMNGIATPFDGMCEANALSRIAQKNAANIIIIFAGAAHIKRLENHMQNSNYKKINAIKRKKIKGEPAIINYEKIKQWLLLSSQQKPRRSERIKKRKQTEQNPLPVKKQKI